jgi:hypothetical protein
VVAHADERAEDLVARRDPPQVVDQLVLPARLGQPQRLAHPDGGGNGRVHERVQAVEAEDGQHLLHLGRVGADVAAREGVAGC